MNQSLLAVLMRLLTNLIPGRAAMTPIVDVQPPVVADLDGGLSVQGRRARA